ncbi:MAG: TonB-dependent receptor [Terriglobales bacterium]
MFSHKGICTHLCAIALVAMMATAASAQVFRGSISGTVTDQSDAVVPNATAVATAIATGVSYTTTASTAGEFKFQDLPLGEYNVVVSTSGFASVKIEKVPVSAGTTYTLHVKILPAQVLTTVDVNAAPLALETEESTLETTLPNTAVQNTPNNGRDFTLLVGITTGSAGYNVPGGGGSSSSNGNRPNSINFQIEGTDNNDPWWNISAANASGATGIASTLIPMDAINQASFATSSSAEAGRNAGGTMNLVIKSGTNGFHGSAYYYNRNEFFAAKTPFAPAGTGKTKDRDQNEGFSFGGPIIKNKTFFFTAFEYQGFTIGNTSTSTEPSAAYQALAESELAFYGMPVNPVSTALLGGLWPADALTGPAQEGNYFDPKPAGGHSYNGLLKLDNNFNPNNNLSLKAFAGQGWDASPSPSFLAPYYTAAPIHVQNYSAIYNRVFSPHLADQIAVGVNYFKVIFSDSDTNFNPVALGLNTGVTDPGLSGSPFITIQNFDVIGPQTTSGRKSVTAHVDEVLSYITGKHQMRFGGEYRRVRMDVFWYSAARGTFNFDGSQGPWGSTQTPACLALATQNLGETGPSTDPFVLALSDFMAGCVERSSIEQGDPKRLVYVNSFNLFAQDSWQVTKKLNLNYGLRWDYSGPPHNGNDDLTVFDPNAPNGLAVAGKDIANVYKQYWKQFSPRLGFAYQPKQDGGLVIRGGFGLYSDSPYMIPFLNLHGQTNGGAAGLQYNPAGTKPTAFPTVSGFVITQDQPIFPPLDQSIAGAGVISVYSINPHYRASSTASYNLNVQHSLGRAVLFQVGYVGGLGRHLTSPLDINQAAQGSAFESPTCAPQYASAGLGNQQCSRPYFAQFPNYSVINQLQSGANSNYNSLQAFIRTQAWHGFTSQFNYTWSHALDYETGLVPYVPQDSTNLKGEYGNSDFDTRSAFVGYFNYEVPGSSHGPKWLSHGWQLNGGLTFHGGQPFTVVASSNQSGNGENADRADAVPGVSPFAGVSHSIVNGVVQWFNPAAFVDPPQGQYGTTTRGQYRNPGYSEVDFSVFKDTHLTEKITLQLRVEMFNLFNRVNLAPAGFPVVPDTAGAIYSTIGAYFAVPGIGPGEPFNTQLAAKIIF